MADHSRYSYPHNSLLTAAYTLLVIVVLFFAACARPESPTYRLAPGGILIDTGPGYDGRGCLKHLNVWTTTGRTVFTSRVFQACERVIFVRDSTQVAHGDSYAVELKFADTPQGSVVFAVGPEN